MGVLPPVRQVDLPDDPNLPGAGTAPAKQVFAEKAPTPRRSSGEALPSPRGKGISDGVARRASASSDSGAREGGRAASDAGEAGAAPCRVCQGFTCDLAACAASAAADNDAS